MEDSTMCAPQLAQTNWKSIYIIAVVAFITSLEFAANNDWNYFCQLDSSATITFYGILRTVGGLSTGISTLLAGWICNKLRDTREVLIGSKVLIIVSFSLFLSAELVHGVAFYAFFLLYKLLLGIANGGGSMSRTHVAMASTERDRNKAIGLCALLPAVGLLIGFLVNAATSFLQYPGLSIPLLSIHLNLFTAPILFSMLIFTLALYLLIFHFDGKWHNHEKVDRLKEEQHRKGEEGRAGRRKGAEWDANGGIGTGTGDGKVELRPVPVQCRLRAAWARCFDEAKFDWVGVAVCLFTQLVVSLAMLNILTINAPYQQLAFRWDAAQLQFYGGLSGAAVAVQLIFWPSAYMLFGLNKIISERNSVMLGLAILLAGYLLTYSWPFMAHTIAYAQQNTSSAAFSSAGSISSCGGDKSQPGCPAHYIWCGTTTKPNLILYISAFVLTTGMAMPIIRMNLDILYSKMLGNIKQGVMQGLFVLFQSVLEMAGAPIVVSWVFEKTGPKHIWQFIGSSLALCFFLWLLFYKRMISHSERLEELEARKRGRRGRGRSNASVHLAGQNLKIS